MPQWQGVAEGRGETSVATVTVGNATAVKFNKIPISSGHTHTHGHNFGNFQTLSVRSGCSSFHFHFRFVFIRIFHLTFALASLLLCSCAHLIELQTLRSSQFSQLGRSRQVGGNSSSSCHCHFSHTPHTHSLSLSLLIAGNVFVIAAIILERNLQNVANYLVASLAVADLFVACLVMPLGAVYEVSKQEKTLWIK